MEIRPLLLLFNLGRGQVINVDSESTLTFKHHTQGV